MKVNIKYIRKQILFLSHTFTLTKNSHNESHRVHMREKGQRGQVLRHSPQNGREGLEIEELLLALEDFVGEATLLCACVCAGKREKIGEILERCAVTEPQLD